MNRYTNGFEVEFHQARVTGGPPPHVVLHKLGTPERTWLTPDEARRLADALTQAAFEAERQT
jgi:hypothetical protein